MAVPPSTTPLPSWVHPAVRLYRPGRRVADALELAAQVAVLRSAIRRETPTVLAVDGSDPVMLATAVIHAATTEVALVCLRKGTSPPGAVRIVAADRLEQPDDSGPALEPGLWLETSGTTGLPKRIRHTLDGLLGRIPATPATDAVWLLTYDPCGFAGLQVLLTVLRGGATLVAEPGADAAALARLAQAHGVTHASGTPSFWRALLLTGARPPLRAITIGGEAVDQPLLDALAATFPQAKLRHIYASTEAGALFAVTDGRAGFPATWLETGVDGVALRLAGDMLEVRSPRRAADAVTGPDGWLATGDLVQVRGDRVLFRGRQDGVVNVGGVKVLPEEVEARLLAVPGLRDAAVTAVPSPLVGRLLVAEVVPEPGVEEAGLRAAIRDALADLPPAARPRRIELVPAIALLPSGKKRRLVVDA